MLGQATSRGQVAEGIRQYGVAPGGRKMIDWEAEAAQMAIETGMYVTWRSRNGTDCTRVGPDSKCFCGHTYKDHTFVSKKAVYPRCTTCPCQGFAFVPQRPEEVGDWWLPRRKGFNVHTWRAKCRCGHGHDDHDPQSRRCMCGCGIFQSNFACVVCDLKWEDHETVFETTQERISGGRPVGEAFRPLSNDRDIQDMVFPGSGDSSSRIRALPGNSGGASRARPAQVDARRAEKSVQIMHANCGGRIADQGIANRWGKVENPPEEWLYKPPGLGAGQPSPRALEYGGPSPSGRAATGPARPMSRGRDSPVSRAGAGSGTMRPPSRGAADAAVGRPSSRGRQGPDGGSRPSSRGIQSGMSVTGSSIRPVSGRAAATAGYSSPRSVIDSAQMYKPPAMAGQRELGVTKPSTPQLSSGFRPVYD